jgi:hypothetical protein
MDRHAILEAASSLSTDDRAILVEEMIQSLDAELTIQPDPELLKEWRRRSAELRQFPERAIDSEVVLNDLEQQYCREASR